MTSNSASCSGRPGPACLSPWEGQVVPVMTAQQGQLDMSSPLLPDSGDKPGTHHFGNLTLITCLKGSGTEQCAVLTGPLPSFPEGPMRASKLRATCLKVAKTQGCLNLKFDTTHG